MGITSPFRLRQGREEDTFIEFFYELPEEVVSRNRGAEGGLGFWRRCPRTFQTTRGSVASAAEVAKCL